MEIGRETEGGKEETANVTGIHSHVGEEEEEKCGEPKDSDGGGVK